MFMDFELRSVLLIVGVVVIAAILLHGLFSIRQANKPVDISHLDLSETDDKGDLLRDSSGFDRHGVGVARVVEPNEQPIDTTTSPEEQLSLDIGSDSEKLQTPSIDFDVALDETTDEKGEINETTAEKAASPMFASPIAKEKEDFLAVKTPPKVNVEEQQTLDLDAEDTAPRMGSFGIDIDENAQPEPAVETTPIAESTSEQAKPVVDPMDVLILNVVGEDGGELDGATLLPVLLTLGFKFGDMNIFHRHVDPAGQGAVLFSLANMVNPGVFDIDNMEQFTTTGVSLFMTLPHDSGNMETFNKMLNAAAKIAEEFNGQVLDGDRSTLTKQSTQLYVQRIREVERKLLLVK